MARGRPTLVNARSIASEFPERFWIPADENLAAITPGMLVKVRAVELGPDSEADFWNSAPVWMAVEQVDGDLVHGTVTDTHSSEDSFARRSSCRAM